MSERMSADEYRELTAPETDRGHGSYVAAGSTVVACNPAYDEAELSVMVKRILGHHGWHEPRHASEHTRALVFTTEQRRASRVTEGLPDLLVQLPGTDRLIGVELKTPKGKLSRLQTVVERLLGSTIWRTPADAWVWCKQHTEGER